MSNTDAFLWVPTSFETFDASDEDRFLEALEDQESRTVVRNVGSITELFIDSNGYLPDGKRYTHHGFRQVMAFAVPGAYDLVWSLASGNSKRGDDPDPIAAANLANEILRLRAGRFEGRARLVCDEAEGHVEGILGPGFIYYSHRNCINHVQASAASAGYNRLQQAIRYGRRLTVRYIGSEPVITGPPKEMFYPGIFVFNSESGDAALRFLPLLGRDDGGSISKTSGGRIIHAGRRFSSRIGRTLSRTLSYSFDPDRLRARMDALAKTELKLGELSNSRIKQIASVLNTWGIPRILAAQLVKALSHFGSSWSEFDSFLPVSVTKRTNLEFFLLLVDCGRHIKTSVRESIEHAAWDLLFGNLKF